MCENELSGPGLGGEHMVSSVRTCKERRWKLPRSKSARCQIKHCWCTNSRCQWCRLTAQVCTRRSHLEELLLTSGVDPIVEKHLPLSSSPFLSPCSYCVRNGRPSPQRLDAGIRRPINRLNSSNKNGQMVIAQAALRVCVCVCVEKAAWGTMVWSMIVFFPSWCGHFEKLNIGCS